MTVSCMSGFVPMLVLLVASCESDTRAQISSDIFRK